MKSKSKLLRAVITVLSIVAIPAVVLAVSAAYKISTDDGASSMVDRFTVEEGAATVNAYFENVNVGIGSTAPTSALDVSGTVTATAFSGSGASLTSIPASSLNSNDLDFTELSNSMSLDSSSTITFGVNNLTMDLDSSGYFAVDLSSTGDFLILKNGSTKHEFNSDGNVGIGMSSPHELLTVQGVISLDRTSAPTKTNGYGKVYVSSSDGDLHYLGDDDVDTNLLPASIMGSSERIKTQWNSSTPYYYAPSDSTGQSESYTEIYIPFKCRMTNFRVWSPYNAHNGTVVVTVRKNGTDTALTHTISASTTGASSWDTDIVEFDQGDQFCIKRVRNGNSGTMYWHWVLEVNPE